MDDFLFLINVGRFWPQATFLLFLLCIFGTPFSWNKLAAGMRLTWIGFHLNAKVGVTGLDLYKRAELVQVLHQVLHTTFATYRTF